MVVILFAIIVTIIAICIACRGARDIGGEDPFARLCAFCIMGVVPLAVLVLSLWALIHEMWGV